MDARHACQSRPPTQVAMDEVGSRPKARPGLSLSFCSLCLVCSQDKDFSYSFSDSLSCLFPLSVCLVLFHLLYVCLSVCRSVGLSICLSVCLSVCLSITLSLCLHLPVCISLFVCLSRSAFLLLVACCLFLLMRICTGAR
jgi:centrosomal protein CEP104